jgi:hypothetical protein
MKTGYQVALGGGAILLCGLALLLLRIPASDVTVVNHYGHPIERVVVKGPHGVAMALNDIPAGATIHGHAIFRGEGAVSYELKAVGLNRSGPIGFVNPHGSYGFTITIEKDGFVSWGESAQQISLSFN